VLPNFGEFSPTSKRQTLAHRIADGLEPTAAPKLPLVRQFADTEGENCEKIFGNFCDWHWRHPPRESMGWAGHVEKTNPTVARTARRPRETAADPAAAAELRKE
jgi:hypothetical protein